MTKEECKKILSEETPLEQILTLNEMRDAFDVIGMVGGDVLHYRVFKSDGSVYAK